MDYLSSSLLFDDPLHQQNDDDDDDDVILQNITDFMLQMQSEEQGDRIIPTLEEQNNEQLNNILHENPIDIIAQPNKRSLSTLTNLENHQEIDEMKKKQKIIHREVERQRRHEMSSLHSSLKSLLPLQYIKGKRSISDHLNEAIKYIKHMQQKIKVLNEKKDGLRREICNSKMDEYENDVIVNVFKESLEVIVSSTYHGTYGSQRLPLSKVLQCLLEQGFDVVSSISKEVKSRMVHSIHVQVGDKDSSVIDASKLKEKLAAIQCE